MCGLDGSRASLEAVRQAARLTVPGGPVTLVAVVDFFDALAMRAAEEARGAPRRAEGPDASELVAALRERAGDWLREAARQVGQGHPVGSLVGEGRPADALRDEASRAGASLLAVGAHGRSRLAGVALGRTGTLLLHEAPCAVLVARPSFDPAGFPRRAVVGVDGSPGSRDAMRVAESIARAHGTALDAVAAEGDDGADTEAARAVAGAAPLRIVPGRPVEALVAAAHDADLLVVGSRGLRGARALGSVSERVAHGAPSSVLVVRPAPGADG
jgi:nucleotide-binding universal stress UspA family protein